MSKIAETHTDLFHERLITLYSMSNTIDILIKGETGTGKTYLAKQIHRISGCKGKFIHIHTPLLKSDLWQSELFGHEAGSFTNALKRHIGKVERAHHGTLFFDEIVDIPLHLQSALLDLLETKTFSRIGNHKIHHVHTKFIFATNQNLEDLLHSQKIRQDFYHRLQVGEIKLPPLRKTPDKIKNLALHFIKKYDALEKKSAHHLAPNALEQLIHYQWPGNIRELEHVIQRAVLICNTSVIQPEHLLFTNVAS